MDIHIGHIDDSPIQRKGVKFALEGKPHREADYPDKTFRFNVTSFVEKKEIKSDLNIDLFLLDIDLGKGNGNQESKDVLNLIQIKYPDAIIIMYSNQDDDDTVVEFLTLGAHNFVSKTSDLIKIVYPIIQTYMTAITKRQSVDSYKFKLDKNKYIGQTILSKQGQIAKIIDNSAIRSVFVSGETGTGKEVVACMIKDIASSLNNREIPFAKVNCGAIPENLIESELFGSTRGAFTGAIDKKGIFESADGGWVFLDEVATLSMAAQIALLRAIENNEISRVGESKVRNVNVRVISATNENLTELAEQGKFRFDLIQRLNGQKINLPPLRERTEKELENLILHFASTSTKKKYRLPQTTLSLLKKHNWAAGNIRELRNAISSMICYATSNNAIYPNAIPDYIFDAIRKPEAINSISENFGFSLVIDDNLCTRKDIEKLVFSNMYNALKHKLSLKEIGTKFGISHMTTISLAKRCEEDELIKLDNFRTRTRRSNNG